MAALLLAHRDRMEDFKIVGILTPALNFIVFTVLVSILVTQFYPSTV